ncbi:MAG: hypothetical protein CM1200mP29_14910 [Verrucomicrobiota bacterium]|nr:MAG: hypothetical protein CM1200mP29_14910 [Verrucomicrobiota bacterium]
MRLASSPWSIPVHTHDFHATILHLLGLNHERLTYFHDGRDFRLTDVSGQGRHRCFGLTKNAASNPR